MNITFINKLFGIITVSSFSIVIRKYKNNREKDNESHNKLKNEIYMTRELAEMIFEAFD